MKVELYMKQGRVCIITGATSGIGKVMAQELAKKGFDLVLPVRNMQKGQKLKEQILSENDTAIIDLFHCDLASLDSVKSFCDNFCNNYSKLDVLINNAGVWNKKRKVTVDGFEETFAVNHLSHFLMTNLLLDMLTASNDGRIINVASEAHRFARLNFDDLMSSNYSHYKVYGRSKLANILFTLHLDSIINSDNLTVNCLHPGVVATNLFDRLGVIINKLFKLFMVTSQEGAKTAIYLATSKEIKNTSGKYFKNCKQVQPWSAARDKNAAKKLWNESLKLTRAWLK